MTLNPALFETIYTGLLNTKKSREKVRVALEAVDAYLAVRASSLFAPVIAHLRDVGEARSCAEIDDHFVRHFDVRHVDDGVRVPGGPGLDR